MKPKMFLETALTLLEDELDRVIERHYKQTGVATVTHAEAMDAIVRNADKFSKEELLRLIIQDAGEEILDAWAAGLRASNNIPAKSYGSFVTVREEKDYDDLFGHDVVSDKIKGSLKRRGEARLSEIIKDTKELEITIEAKIKRLCDDGLVGYRSSENGLFDTKIYYILEGSY